MAITPFKVIQGHRFWYQSKARCEFLKFLLVIYDTNLSRILHRFQVRADYRICQIFASDSRLTLSYGGDPLPVASLGEGGGGRTPTGDTLRRRGVTPDLKLICSRWI